MKPRLFVNFDWGYPPFADRDVTVSYKQDRGLGSPNPRATTRSSRCG